MNRPVTTVDRLREVIAETICVDAQGLQAAIGQLTVAVSADYPDASPHDACLHDTASACTVLLADRITAGREAQVLAAEIVRHHGRQAALTVFGDRADELLGAEPSNHIERPSEPQGEMPIPKNVLGRDAAQPYYIWANDDCANKSERFAEAKAIRLELINEGCSFVYIADADGIEVVDEEIEAHEALANAGYFAGARKPDVKPEFPGAFMVNDPLDADGFAIVGDDIGSLILEAQSMLGGCYAIGEKHSGPVSEIKFLPLHCIERKSMDHMPEVLRVSDEVAASMDFSEPIEVTAFRFGQDNDDLKPVVLLQDGHHRTAAAIQTNREYLPVKVQAINAKGEKLNALIALSREIENRLRLDSSISIDRYHDSLSPGDRPVFDQSVGGFVIASQRNLGVSPHSYRPVVQALAESRGVQLSDEEPQGPSM